MDSIRKIAVICDYRLLPERIGGMDYFFWKFDEKCRDQGIHIDWFFPNTALHGDYSKLHIIVAGSRPEVFFMEHYRDKPVPYTHVMTHFVELCTKFTKEIKNLTKAKIIAVDHNPRPLGGYNFKKKIVKRLKGFLYTRFTDVFVAVSEETGKALGVDFGKPAVDKSIIIFNGLDQDIFRKKTDFTGKRKFIIACHLRQSKGIQDVITAVSKLKNTSGLIIDIYGTGPYEETLKEMVRKDSLTTIFHFKGSVTNLNLMYADYDYLIHPSHAETFCYTVVESLMSNLPVITTLKEGNVLGLVKVPDNGYLYEAGNVAALTAILSDIVNMNSTTDIPFVSNPKLNELTLDSMVENYFKLLS